MTNGTFFQTLLQQGIESGSRSTILKPLLWMNAAFIAALLTAIMLKSPTWVLIFLAILASLAFISAIGSYVYCLLNNPEALRSESYSIQKLAIQKGIFGDSTTGVIIIPAPSEAVDVPKVLTESEK